VCVCVCVCVCVHARVSFVPVRRGLSSWLDLGGERQFARGAERIGTQWGRGQRLCGTGLVRPCSPALPTTSQWWINELIGELVVRKQQGCEAGTCSQCPTEPGPRSAKQQCFAFSRPHPAKHHQAFGEPRQIEHIRRRPGLCRSPIWWCRVLAGVAGSCRDQASHGTKPCNEPPAPSAAGGGGVRLEQPGGGSSPMLTPK